MTRWAGVGVEGFSRVSEKMKSCFATIARHQKYPAPYAQAGHTHVKAAQCPTTKIMIL